MSYKHIVANMGQPLSDRRTRIAARLAQAHGAYLVGRHYTVQRHAAGPGATQVSPGQLGSGAVAAQEAQTPAMNPEQSREVSRARKLFDDSVKEAGVQGDFEALPADTRPLWECLLDDARCTDLTIVGKPNGGDADKDTIRKVGSEAGGPLLVVPDSTDDTPGAGHVVIAWNGTAEAARAVQGAMPLIEAAGRATILMVKPKPAAQTSARRLQTVLEQHGASVEVKHESSGSMKVSDSLISRAEEAGADVVVMGAFGRARLQEVITGGATTARTIESATVPLLVAH